MLFALYLSFTHALQYVSLSLKLTPLRSLQTDCFLIGGVPEVVVVMVTCEGHLERVRRWWLGEGGRGHPLKKTEGSTHARLGWSLQKMDSVCVFDILTTSV